MTLQVVGSRKIYLRREPALLLRKRLGTVASYGQTLAGPPGFGAPSVLGWPIMTSSAQRECRSHRARCRPMAAD